LRSIYRKIQESPADKPWLPLCKTYPSFSRTLTAYKTRDVTTPQAT
jgi:hypothetical protein